MKNSYNPENASNENSSFISISTKLHKPRILKNMVEVLAEKKVDVGYCHEKVQPGWQAVDTSSAEVFVSGDLNISTEMEHVYSTFLTNFYFTCTKDKGAQYKLLWISSLS